MYLVVLRLVYFRTHPSIFLESFNFRTVRSMSQASISRTSSADYKSQVAFIQMYKKHLNRHVKIDTNILLCLINRMQANKTGKPCFSSFWASVHLSTAVHTHTQHKHEVFCGQLSQDLRIVSDGLEKAKHLVLDLRLIGKGYSVLWRQRIHSLIITWFDFGST